VFRPVSPDEILSFYHGKVKNMSKALAVMMASGGAQLTSLLLNLM
jgi:hypothetical protein